MSEQFKQGEEIEVALEETFSVPLKRFYVCKYGDIYVVADYNNILTGYNYARKITKQPLAGHNPDGVTELPSGCIRLLDEDEIIDNNFCTSKIRTYIPSKKAFNEFTNDTYYGSDKKYTYATSLTREELAEKRGLNKEDVLGDIYVKPASGGFCIGRHMEKYAHLDCVTWEFWTGNDWASAGKVYCKDEAVTERSRILTKKKPIYTAWTSIEEVPLDAWFRDKGDTVYFRITSINNDTLNQLLNVKFDGMWADATKLYIACEYSTDLKSWHVCGKEVGK
jgi:hypothetical protein